MTGTPFIPVLSEHLQESKSGSLIISDFSKDLFFFFLTCGIMEVTHVFSATEYMMVLLQIKVHFFLSHADSDLTCTLKTPA